MDVSKEELSLSVESQTPTMDGDVAGVAPVVLIAVVLGVLCAVALLFSMAFFMDRWNTGAKPDRNGRGSSHRSTKITILDDMCPDPTSDPPAAAAGEVSAGTSSEC